MQNKHKERKFLQLFSFTKKKNKVKLKQQFIKVFNLKKRSFFVLLILRKLLYKKTSTHLTISCAG